jgi:PhnB protein
MKDINCYLTFDGNCAEAMKFYQKALKAEMEMMPFSQIPGQQIPPGSENRIMHARLQKGTAILMASDTMPGHPFTKGTNFSVSVNCGSKQEVDEYFGALKEGGKVTMPAQQMFWGAYFAMLTDKFGVNWMFNFDTPK